MLMCGCSQPRKNPVVTRTTESDARPTDIFKHFRGENLKRDVTTPPARVPLAVAIILSTPVKHSCV